jgi:SPP1 family predicted phage head-tail adaptor
MTSEMLNTRIIIQKFTSYINENGFPVEEWVNLATVWSNKRGLSGREYYAAASVQSETEIIFTIRFMAGLDTSMQILHGAVKHDIKSIIDRDGRRCWLEIHAVEVVPGGN